MRILGALATITLAACGGGDTTIDITHDACAPLALAAAEPTAVQQAAMAAAETLWRARGAPALGLSTGSVIEIRFEPAAAAFRGLYDDERGLIFINRNITSESVLSIVIAHELGHAFGLQHVGSDERRSLMNPGNLATPPTEADQRALEALWGACD